MKAKEKRMILILVLITAIVIVINIVVKNRNKEEESSNSNTELVQTQVDGTKTSISNAIAEQKKFEEFEVTNTSITEKNGLATLTASITNNTNNEIKEFPVRIKLLNKNREVIQEIGAYVGTMKAGETRQINATVNMDISEIYDFEITRK